MADTDLGPTIGDAAQDPRRAEGDQGSMEHHNLKDLIEADRHLAARRAAAKRLVGMRLRQFKPPGMF